jgi:hypothetical protein
MRTATLTRVAVVAAITATAGLALAGPANAAKTPAPVAKTTLKIAEVKDVITGTLAEGKIALAKETVSLWTVSGKKTAPAGTGVTNKAGVVTFKIKPAATTTYELVFKGTKDLGASHSAEVTVKVAAPVKTK